MLITVIGRRDDIHRAAVHLLNSVGLEKTTVQAVCGIAGVTPAEFAQSYQSMTAVFAAIITSLTDAQNAKIAGTILCRRSLTESVQIAMSAVWKLVEQHPDDYLAVRILTAAELNTSLAVTGAEQTIHEAAIEMVEQWLLDIQNVHHMSWQLPTRQLARLTLATLDGLVLDYLFDRDGVQVRRLLDIFSFQLAQHGRRAAKSARP
jgi:TetR/AcrR family transcriptional repressor of acrEF/envCD operon